jgi:metacaspase-1
MDGEENGAFTGALKKIWAGGKFKGNYRSFRDKIGALLPSTQSPNYYFIGAPHAAFEAQKPFTI